MMTVATAGAPTSYVAPSLTVSITVSGASGSASAAGVKSRSTVEAPAANVTDTGNAT